VVEYELKLTSFSGRTLRHIWSWVRTAAKSRWNTGASHRLLWRYGIGW
jgi:hypothetical protein